MKKHPVLFGILLTLAGGIAFIFLFSTLGSVTGEGVSFTRGDKIGMVTIEGIIASSQETVSQIENFGKDNTIKAVVLRIDSPGGGVAPSQEIYAAVKELRKKKRVVASLGSIAASGGYLIACAAEKIAANPGTLTGSISTIMYFANAEDLMKKIGLKSSVIKSGKYKDIGSPAREMTEEEKKIFQELVDDTYDQFLEAIVNDRKISKEELRQIADGRVFSGRQALKLKLVDFLGGSSYAVHLAGKMAGIEGEPQVVYPREKGFTFWEYLVQNTGATFAGIIKGRVPAIPQGINYLFEHGA